MALPSHLTLTWSAQVVLGLTVWLISLADTLLSLRRGIRTSARHRLYARHQRSIIIGLGVVACFTLIVALTQLPAHILAVGWELSVGVIIYLVAVGWGPRWLLYFKPLAFGAFLLLGCANTISLSNRPEIWMGATSPNWFPVLAFMSLPFVLYAAIIAASERKVGLEPPSKISQSLRKLLGFVYGINSFFWGAGHFDLIPMVLFLSLVWQIACWESLQGEPISIRKKSLLAIIGMIGPPFAYLIPLELGSLSLL